MNQNGADAMDRTLYCGNICEKVTEDLLYELFQQGGPLESVTIAKDKEGNRRKFGFITFKDAVSVDYTSALMTGVSLFGKTLRLQRRTGARSDNNPYMEQLINYKQSVFGQAPRTGESPYHGPSRGTKRKHRSETNSYSGKRRAHCDVPKGDRFCADFHSSSDQSPSEHYGHSSTPHACDNDRWIEMSEVLPGTPSPRRLDYNDGRIINTNRNLDGYAYYSRNSFGRREDVRTSHCPVIKRRDNERNGRSCGQNVRDYWQRSSFGSATRSPNGRPEMPCSSRHRYEPYDHRSSDHSSRDRASQRSDSPSTLRYRH